MIKKYFTLNWFRYHLLMFLKLIFIFQPLAFRPSKNHFPIKIVPYGKFQTFLFVLVSSLWIYTPILFFILQLLSNQKITPELFIISAFGLIFGTFIRNIQHDTISYIQINRNNLTLTYFGLYKPKAEVFNKNMFNGLTLYKDNYNNTKNYKVCITLEDGKQIMLKLTIFSKKAERLLHNYSEILNLKIIAAPAKQIINDMRVTTNK